MPDLSSAIRFVFCPTPCHAQNERTQLRQPLEYAYALRPHAQSWRAANLPRQAAVCRNPPIALIHGDLPLAGEREAHATTGYYAQHAEGEISVDANRSTWKSYHGERDGWRRVEPDRFLPCHCSGAM